MRRVRSRDDVMKVMTGASIAFLMVILAFVPLSSPDHYSNTTDVSTKGGPVCEGSGCKLPYPGDAPTYHYKDISSPPTNSRADTNKFAVLAGISDYPGSGNDLNYCDDDVYDTRNKLVSFGWSSSNIHLLIDNQATNSNILDEIAWMKQQENADSQVYFHFSGHGTTGQFLTYGSTMTDDTLANAFNGFESTQMVIVMDTCHAGSFSALNMGNAIGIMACQSSQYSYDGMFTPVFMSKFTSSSVSVETAFNNAKTSVNSQTGGAQTPLMWDNVAGNLLLGNRAPTIGGIPSFDAEEDSPIVMDLTPYESDQEDSGTSLDWIVTDYDAGIIVSITGQQSDDDIITLHPSADYAGTTNIELTLMDSGGQTAKKTVMVTWTPVNDAPTMASLDRSSSTVLRTQSLIFKVFGNDKDDQGSKVDAEVEVSPQGSGQWEALSGSTFVSGHWEVPWTPGMDADIGSYDIRARLEDEAGLLSDWLTRLDLIEVRNNRPEVTSMYVPYSDVERTRELTISIYGEDIEDPAEDMSMEFEYRQPGGDFMAGNPAVFLIDHWDVVFSPSVEAPLGWYDIRTRLKDVDDTYSPWFYDNASIEVKNSRPFVTGIEPEESTVLRDSLLYIEVIGWDPEDSNIHLVAEVQYMEPDGEWIDMSDGIEFSSDHWWAIFQPDVDAVLGDYTIRARLIDTSTAQSDWYVLNESVEVVNNPPTVTSVDGNELSVIRTHEISLTVRGQDIEDAKDELTLEAEMSPMGKGTWTTGSVTGAQWSPSTQAWTVTISPHAHVEPGDYDLRLRLTDTDDGAGPWFELNTPIKIINGLPVIDLDYPDVVNEKEATTFDASGSYDPEGGALGYSWDFGDGSDATNDAPVHAYKKAKTYTLTLTVKDMDGAETIQTISLTVNAVPIGVVKAVQETGLNNFAVNFDTAGSRDPDGKIVTYRWDLDTSKDTNGDGDPANDVDSTDRNPTFDYGGSGTYSYKLVITDDKGATTDIRGDITVSSMSMVTTGLIGGISMIIVIAAVAALLLMRRKRRKGDEPHMQAAVPVGPPPEGENLSLMDHDDELLGFDGPGKV